MKVLLLAILSICLSVGAQFALKAGVSSTQDRPNGGESSGWATVHQLLTSEAVIVGLLLYFLSAVSWLGVLSKWDVSKAYPLVGLGFVMTAFVGSFTGESVSTARLIGIGLISVGVWVVARS